MLLGPSGQAAGIESKLRGLLKTDINGKDRFQDALDNGLADTDYNTCAVFPGFVDYEVFCSAPKV